MSTMFVREKIDELRDLLELHNRSVVSVVALKGIVETTADSSSTRTFEESGDVAYVFVGPKDKLVGEIRVADDDSRTYTLTIHDP
jgi:hypothetical protein